MAISSRSGIIHPDLTKPTPIISQQWSEETKPFVSVSCNTYMHAPFIRDAIEGFLLQETTFPVEILIHDDASPDGTADIVREYEAKHPQLIKATYQVENQYKKNPKTSKYVKPPPRRGKYIAMCEGDDYWTDPLKLQKQVDFLEENPDFSMCFHSVELVDGHKKTGKIAGAGLKELVFTQDKLFYSGGFHSPSASLVYRKEITINRPSWSIGAPVGDITLKLLAFLNGKVFYIPQTMGVRRINVPGSWNERVRKNPQKEYEYHLGMIKMLDNFNESTKYQFDTEVTDKQFSYLMRTFPFISFSERLRISRTVKNKRAINRLGKKQKLIFYLSLIFPGILHSNNLLRRSVKNLKKHL